MADETMCRRHISLQHLEVLAQYMERYPSLALSSARSRDGLIQSKRMWEKIARTLNRIEEGVTKNGRSWARYWNDLKFKIRRKYMMLQKCSSEGHVRVVHLTPIEQKLVKVLTDDEGNLRPAAYSQIGSYRSSHYTFKSGNTRIPSTEKDRDPVDSDSKIDDSGGTPDTIITDSNYLLSIDKRLEHESDIKPNIDNFKTLQDPIQIMLPEERKSIEDLRRELVEFELRKQKELFEVEKLQKREKHELEMSILRIKKEILLKELKKL